MQKSLHYLPFKQPTLTLLLVPHRIPMVLNHFHVQKIYIFAFETCEYFKANVITETTISEQKMSDKSINFPI